MIYKNIVPNKSIGMFIIGESINSLRKRLPILNIDIELKPSSYTNQLLESTILLDGKEVIMIEYFNNKQPLLYNDINIFGSSYKELKKIGKKNKYDVSDVDMGFMWKKLKLGFFFEERDAHRYPDTLTIFTNQYEETLEQSLSESEENIDLSITYDNEIKPNESIGDFFLGESLFLVEYRFDSQEYKLEILNSIKKDNTKSCYIYKNEIVIAHLDFSIDDKVECIKNYKSPLYYEGKNLFNESYYSLSEMGKNKNYVIEEIPQGFTWSDLGISFYFNEKKSDSLPEAVEIHKI